MRVRAKEKTYYDKRDRFPGDEYDMDDREQQEARLLQALGKIEILPPVVAVTAPEPPPYVAPTITETELPTPPPEEPPRDEHGRFVANSPETEKRRYRRRPPT